VWDFGDFETAPRARFLGPAPHEPEFRGISEILAPASCRFRDVGTAAVDCVGFWRLCRRPRKRPRRRRARDISGPISHAGRSFRAVSADLSTRAAIVWDFGDYVGGPEAFSGRRQLPAPVSGDRSLGIAHLAPFGPIFSPGVIVWDFGDGISAAFHGTRLWPDPSRPDCQAGALVMKTKKIDSTYNQLLYLFPVILGGTYARFKISKIPHNYPRRSSGPTPATPAAAYIESAEIHRHPPGSTDVVMRCEAPLTRDAHRPRSRGSRHSKRPLPHNPTKSHTITRATVCAAGSRGRDQAADHPQHHDKESIRTR